MEIMSDSPVEDVHAWQRPEHLATLMGISERSLRQWAKNGKAEKSRLPGGAVYYRIPEGMEAAGTPEAAVPEVGEVLALVERVTETYEERLEVLRDRITSEAVAAAEARVLADVAVRDLERVQHAHLSARDELEELRAKLARAHAHAQTLEAANSLPWWAWTRKKQLRLAMVAGLLESP